MTDRARACACVEESGVAAEVWAPVTNQGVIQNQSTALATPMVTKPTARRQFRLESCRLIRRGDGLDGCFGTRVVKTRDG